MSATEANRYLVSHFKEVAAENLENARRLRACAPHVIPVGGGENMLAEAKDCARVAEAARKARLAFV